MINGRYSDSLATPSLIRLDKNLILCMFRLMKLVPAKHILSKAWDEGVIDQSSIILESSSGTFALGLGIVCAEMGLSFRIFGDPAIQPPLKSRLKDLGGDITLVSKNDGADGNVQLMRLEALNQFAEEHPGAFWTRQYDNLQNQESYGPAADHVMRHIDGPLTLVGTVGSGGSTCGMIKRMRSEGRDVRLVGVDTFGSVLFGLPNSKRVLRGLGNVVHPRNLEHEHFDEIHWVHEKDAFQVTRALHQRFGVYAGPTTGAAYHVAEWHRLQDPSRTVVFIGPDEGYRYQSTIYTDSWLEELEILGKPLTPEPTLTTHPSKAEPTWSYMNWNRQTFEDVTGETW